jgi:hypothetical protein
MVIPSEPTRRVARPNYLNSAQQSSRSPRACRPGYPRISPGIHFLTRHRNTGGAELPQPERGFGVDSSRDLAG